jgi:hypothetical protein
MIIKREGINNKGFMHKQQQHMVLMIKPNVEIFSG